MLIGAPRVGSYLNVEIFGKHLKRQHEQGTLLGCGIIFILRYHPHLSTGEIKTSLCTSKFVSNVHTTSLNVVVVSAQKGAPTTEQQMAGHFDLIGHTSL